MSRNSPTCTDFTDLVYLKQFIDAYLPHGITYIGTDLNNEPISIDIYKDHVVVTVYESQGKRTTTGYYLDGRVLNHS